MKVWPLTPQSEISPADHVSDSTCAEGQARADTRSEAYWARSSSRGTSLATPRLW